MNLTCILRLIKFDFTLLQDHITTTVVWNSFDTMKSFCLYSQCLYSFGDVPV